MVLGKENICIKCKNPCRKSLCKKCFGENKYKGRLGNLQSLKKDASSEKEVGGKGK